MEKETLQAKLRNKLTPLYSLSSLCIELDKDEFRETLIPLVVENAKNAESNRKKIDYLLTSIDLERQQFLQDIKDLEDEKNRLLSVCKEQIQELTDKLSTLEKLLF